MNKKVLIGVMVGVGFVALGAGGYLLARPLPRMPIAIAPTLHPSPTPTSFISPSPIAVTNSSATTVTPSVGTPSTTPSLITVNTPTTVKVTGRINPAPITGSVNLLRFGATGTQPTILGVMHDDGQNGDVAANDGIYTLQIPINEEKAGQMSLQISAAFPGLLKRISSSIANINIWLLFSSGDSFPLTISYPPTWVASPSDTPGEEYFSPSSDPPDSTLEYSADLIVDVIRNPQETNLQSYYENVAPIDLFMNSQSNFAFVTADGFPAVQFIGVNGMIPTDIISVNTGTTIVEINDVGQKHTADGILQQVANSVR